jgi:hypothetical protein
VDSRSQISGPFRAWQAEWSSIPQLAERQVAAVRNSHLAAVALREYSSAYRRDLNSHADGLAMVAILRLLDHLRTATGLEPAAADVDDIFDLIPAVRLSAGIALARGQDIAGAHATLGELYLVSGDQTSPAGRKEALAHYAQARASEIVRESLLERLRLFAALGFRPEFVSEAMRGLVP